MTTKRYEHLTVDCPLKSSEVLTQTGIDTWFFSILRRVALSTLLKPLVSKTVSFARLCEQLAAAEEKSRRAQELLREEQPNAQAFDSEYGYADELQELQTALDYQRQIDTGVDRTPSESGALYREAEVALGSVISEIRAPAVLNFGVSYAHIDSCVARRHPDCRFIGIDRSRLTERLNRQVFGKISNMEFVSGDIFDFLSGDRDWSGCVFFHARTLILMPKDFIRRLYAAAYRAGFEAVVLFEQVGISRQTGSAYQFTDEDAPSVVFRSNLYIHNYPGLLREAGFLVSDSSLIQTNHPHRNFRLVRIVARRA